MRTGPYDNYFGNPETLLGANTVVDGMEDIDFGQLVKKATQRK